MDDKQEKTIMINKKRQKKVLHRIRMVMGDYTLRIVLANIPKATFSKEEWMGAFMNSPFQWVDIPEEGNVVGVTAVVN